MAVMAAVYLKAMRLASVSAAVGEVISLQSNDAWRLGDALLWHASSLPTCASLIQHEGMKGLRPVVFDNGAGVDREEAVGVAGLASVVPWRR